MIEVGNVTKLYGTLRAVNGVDFKVKRGEVLGLLGPNAAGKTTLMRIMTGYLPATEGTVKIGGKDVFDQPLEAKKNIGYLPENPPLYPEMSVKMYLGFTAEIRGVPRGERRQRVAEVIEMTGLGDVRDRLIDNISKGYRQRVGLAQALVHDPDVLILDEPTVGLDPRQIIDIRNLIKSQAGKRTIVLSSHILPEVSATCDRIVILNRGNVVAVDTQDELTRRASGGEHLRVEIGGCTASDAAEEIEGIEGVVKVETAGGAGDAAKLDVMTAQGADVREAVFKKVVEKEWILLEMSRAGMSLEDVFLQLTTTEEVAHNG